MALLNTEANTVEDLAAQLRAQWSGDWNINGEDQSAVLARMLWDRGVRDASQISTADKAYDYDLRADRGWDVGGDNPLEQRTGKTLNIGGVTLGALGDRGRGDTMGDQYGVLGSDQWGRSELGWNSQGDGAVGFEVVTGEDGRVQIVPSWRGSSDMDDVRGLGMVFGGAALGAYLNGGLGAAESVGAAAAPAAETAATTGATTGATAGTTGGGGLLGGSAGAGGAGLKTTAAMQSAMTPAGLTSASGASLGAAGSVTGGGTGFSLGNLFGGISGKDWLGAVGTAIQYADGRRQQRQTEATRAAERAEDREYNDKIRNENRGWSLEDRDNERAYAAQQLAEKQQRIGTTGGGLLGVSLKRKGT